MSTFPKPFVPIQGPFTPEKLAGAAEGMGTFGDATRALVADGLLQPDLICGMTLALIARQPRRPRPQGAAPAEEKASGVAGGVWVRERFTIHQPVDANEVWEVTGEATGTYVRKGRSYSTTRSESHTSAGRRFATNLTTGLFSYRPDPDLADSVEGLPLDATPTPEPDPGAATGNPHLDRLAALRPGQVLGAVEVPVTLAMMAARDTDNPDNPIHSRPEEARKAGLARPIAGGSHVLAFALEAIMAETGPQALLHGACIEARWKAPTEDGSRIVPTATVTSVSDDAVGFDLRVDLVDGPTAMVGSVVVPLAP